MEATLPMTGFYQFGYVTKDLDAAVETLRERFGIENYRRKQNAPYMEAVHAWTGDTMIEVLQVTDEAPALYTEMIPDTPGELQLHHLGRRLADDAEWERTKQAIDRLGLDVPMWIDVMDGDLQGAYIDTRKDLGIYSEYVLIKGSASGIYDDVPRND